MNCSRLRCAGLAALLALAACSTNPAPGSTSSVTPPRLTGVDHPDLQNVRVTGDSKTDISVMVGADGLPEMATLRVTGSESSSMREPVAEWIARSKFEPARANGVPVRAEFRTSIEMRKQVIRR